MQEVDLPTFERAMRRLCAGFDTPYTDQRKAAYFQGLRRLPVLEVAGLIDSALSESTFVSMPTVGALRELHMRLQPQDRAAPKRGASVQEELCEFATLRLHARLTRLEFSRPWHYTYREWSGPDGKRATECAGVVIDLENGGRMGFTVDQMRAEQAPQSSADAR